METRTGTDSWGTTLLPIMHNRGNVVNIIGNTAEQMCIEVNSATNAKDVPKITEDDVIGVMCGIPRNLEEIVGREDIVAELKGLVEEQKFVVLTGMAGVGKTLTALHCVHKWVPDAFQTAYLVHMDNDETVANSITSFLEYLSIKPNVNMLENVKNIYSFFKNSKCLVVLDNIESMNEHLKFIWTEAKEKNVFFLGTSQFREFRNSFSFELNVLSRNCAVELFKTELLNCGESFIQKNHEDICKLVDILDCHPLGIKVASALIKDTRTNENKHYSVFDYINEHELKLRDRKPFDSNISYNRTVYLAIKTNIDQVKLKDSEAYRLLSLLTFLDTTLLPEYLVDRCFDFTDMNKAVRGLRKFSIIHTESVNGRDCIGIHRLFQIINQELLRDDDKFDWYKRIIFKILLTCSDKNIFEDIQDQLSHILQYFTSEEDLTRGYHLILEDKITKTKLEGDFERLDRKIHFQNIFRMLSQSIISINIVEHWRAWHYAVYRGDLHVIAKLNELDASICCIAKEEWSVLHSLLLPTKLTCLCFSTGNIEALKGIPEPQLTSAVSLFLNKLDDYEIEKEMFIANVFLQLTNDKKIRTHYLRRMKNSTYRKKEGFFFAIRNKLDNVFELFLRAKFDLNTPNVLRNTPINTAVVCNNFKALQRLVESGADVNILDMNGHSPVSNAIDFYPDHLEMIEYLVTHVDDLVLYKSLFDEGNVLHLAIYSGHINIIQCVTAALWTKRRKIKYNKSNPSDCLHLPGFYTLIKSRSIYDEYCKQINNKGLTPSQLAVQRGDLDVVKNVITVGDFDETTEIGGFFHIAAQNGHLTIITFFITYLTEKVEEILLKEYLEKRNQNGLTPLLVATHFGHLELVQYLVSLGVDKNAKTNDDNTVLHLAALNGHQDVMEYFINLEIDTLPNMDINSLKEFLERKNNQGDTPLHVAASTDNLGVVRYLINFDVNNKLRNLEGKTPLDVAREKGHSDVVNYLINLSI